MITRIAAVGLALERKSFLPDYALEPSNPEAAP